MCNVFQLQEKKKRTERKIYFSFIYQIGSVMTVERILFLLLFFCDRIFNFYFVIKKGLITCMCGKRNKKNIQQPPIIHHNQNENVHLVLLLDCKE